MMAVIIRLRAFLRSRITPLIWIKWLYVGNCEADNTLPGRGGRKSNVTISGLSPFLPFFFTQVADAQDEQPYRNQPHGDRHTWRHQHNDQYRRHKQQTENVAERIKQGREAGFTPCCCFARRNIIWARLIIAQLMTSAETTSAISSPNADSGAR